MGKISVKLELGKDYSAQFTVDNVNEIEDKLKEWNSMSDFERDHYAKKGTLAKEIASGWYYLEKSDGH